ncbi:mast/stem cell growth factor receptor Kit-like [Centruroides vittatus]|uniref:mast/stem cell growth factor receptor Kit-like n=1 Tax=Centruroides vittatus TaxID=120091 RepID=UPI00351062AC
MSVAVNKEERTHARVAAVGMHAAANQIFGVILALREKIKELSKLASFLDKGSFSDVLRRNLKSMSKTTKLISENSAKLEGRKNSKKEKPPTTSSYQQSACLTTRGNNEHSAISHRPKTTWSQKNHARPLPSGDIAIQLHDEQDLISLKTVIQNNEHLSQQLRVTERNKKLPKIILLNVSNSTENEELIQQIYDQNHQIKEQITQEDFVENTKLSHSFQQKGTTHSRHVILSVTPRTKNILMQEKRVFVKWYSLTVDDYISTIRCFNCSGYSHTSHRCVRGGIARHRPRIPNVRKPADYPAGSNVTLECRGKLPLKWETPEKLLEHEEYDLRQSETSEGEEYGLTLTLVNAAYYQTGFYTCCYRNAACRDSRYSASVYLFVNDEDNPIVGYEKFVQAYPGEATLLPCRPTFSDLKMTLWTGEEEISAREGVTFDPRRGFVVVNADHGLDGSVVCKTDRFGGFEEYLRVHVHQMPRPLKPFVTRSKDIPEEGEAFSLNCSVEAQYGTTFRIDWRLPGRNLRRRRLGGGGALLSGPGGPRRTPHQVLQPATGSGAGPADGFGQLHLRGDPGNVEGTKYEVTESVRIYGRGQKPFVRLTLEDEEERVERRVREEVRFRVRAEIVPAGRPVDYRWEKDGRPLVRDPRLVLRQGERTAELSLSSLRPEDGGVYTLRVRSGEAEGNLSVLLLVVDAEDGLRAESSEARPVEGEAFRLTCRADDFLFRTVGWRRRRPGLPDLPVEDDPAGGVRVTESDTDVSLVAVLDFPSLGPRHRANYTCAATRRNDSSLASETTVELRVRGKTLGQGAFGRVVKAEARGMDGEGSRVVAVKMLKERADREQKKALMAELKILIHLRPHVNIVNLLGAVTENMAKGELMVVVEYCRYGNLRHYLLGRKSAFVPRSPSSEKSDYENLTSPTSWSQSPGEWSRPSAEWWREGEGDGTSAYRRTGARRESEGSEGRDGARRDPITTARLLYFAYQCARGMQYLSDRKLIHRDLAARNVLVADRHVVKICDFGLAKDCYKYSNYVKKNNGPLPIKWMAIESIRDKVFTTKSDVWSFGVLTWEIFSLGATPYPGMEVDAEFYKMLSRGFRMDRPEYAPPDLYEMVRLCWKAEPEERPTFAELSRRLRSGWTRKT